MREAEVELVCKGTSNTPRASFKHSLVKRSGPEAFPLAPRDTARNTSVVENARSRNASGGPVSDRGKHIGRGE